MKELQIVITVVLVTLASCHKSESSSKQELRTDEHRSHPSYARYDYMDPYASKAVNYNPISSRGFEYDSPIRSYPTRSKVQKLPYSKPVPAPDYVAQKPRNGAATVTSYFRQGYATDDEHMDYKTHYELPTHYPAYRPEYTYSKPVVVDNVGKARRPSYGDEFVPSPPHFYPSAGYVHSPSYFDNRHRYDYGAGRTENVNKGRVYETRASDNRYPLSIYGY